MCAFSPPHWEPMTSYAIDVDPLVVQAVAAKREVLAAKQPDLLGVSRAGWNNSTLSENMLRFPDKPMMRQLSKVRAGLCANVCRPLPTCVGVRGSSIRSSEQTTTFVPSSSTGRISACTCRGPTSISSMRDMTAARTD